MRRLHNVISPKGPGRPRPQYVIQTLAGSLWHYRGREIEVTPGARGSWWAEINVVDPGVRQRMVDAGVQHDLAGMGPAPDPTAALKYAVFTIDGHERLAFRGGLSLVEAMDVIKYAMDDLSYVGTPLTRAAVARQIEVFREDRQYPYPMSAFMALTLPQRVELIDEMLELAEAWGGRYPNPDPRIKAELLAS